ncbi:MAG: helix-turn-helix transcriptional regulator [Gammaproteobacteria bacterium]|nr:MAG: helix-turn-helix transcriptional regulator [Gammaproteobacteria bacterium]
MKAEEINSRAYNYAESTVLQFIDICNPIFKSEIKVFAYFRFFNNGQYLYLCNQLDWLRFCLENVHSNEGTSLGQQIGHVPEDNYYCFLWPTVKSDYLMSALYDFNIWNGLSIFKQREDSIELWGFATDRQTNNLQDFYIENIELLKDFTASFNLNAADLILPTNKNLAVYRDFIPQIHIDEYDRKKIDEFIRKTPIKKRPIITPKGEVFLANKELECLNLLASGKSAKQMAKEFNHSVRTIEKHLENIRHKIACDDKANIIKIYKDSILNWL